MTETDNARWEKVRQIWEIIDRLRGESGCPWDRKQTPESVQTYLIEEAHEAAAAVRSGLIQEAAEELGDLLFMVLFLIHLYEENNNFLLDDVCDLITEKMIRRHPHVFGDANARTPQEVRANWEKIKASEKASGNKSNGGVPESLPALMRAYRLLSRSSHDESNRLNDMPYQAHEFFSKSQLLAEKLKDEEALPPELIGELLINLVNLARLEGYRAEDILHESLRPV
ncbi:MAG: MazG family protein [Desulfoferrobacter sp.]